MAYLALARKWRPKAFSEVVGQPHVVQALSNALDSGQVHHAFLFTGTRGVGKTTLARIFAKSLNCESGVSAEPCQQCNTCVSIDEGRYVDLIEVDAASRTKVDDMRELLENVQYSPTTGSYKVYLIDEVHMLSNHSFNALLKTLEEPPEHIKFLFATTDPQKLPVTVLSRCLQFSLRAMRPEQIENQLVKILNSETIEFDLPALAAIAKAADGSMRDGLSLLDQAIAQGGGAVRESDVRSMLGSIKAQHSEALLSALAQRDIDAVLAVVDEMADHAIDFTQALDEVLMQLYFVSLVQIASGTLNNASNPELISQLAQKIPPQTVQLYYQIGLIGKRDITLAPSLRVGFEMALLRMLAFEPSNQVSNAESPIDESIDQPIDESIKSPASTQAASASASTAMAVNQAGVTQPTQITQQDSIISLTLVGQNEWGELVEQTDLRAMSKELAMNCACEKLNDQHIELALSPKQQHLFKQERLDDIIASLQRLKNNAITVAIEFEDSECETPAQCLDRLGVEQTMQTQDKLSKHPQVQALMSEFDATIDPQSIKPI